MMDLSKHVLRAGFPVWDICNNRGNVEEDFCQGAKKAWSIYLYIRKATYVVGADGESSAGASYKTRIAKRGERDLGPHAGSRNFVISHRCSGERACKSKRERWTNRKESIAKPRLRKDRDRK